MRATHYELFRWQVLSDGGAFSYLVDLMSFDGNGRCTCEDFTIRKEPTIRAAITSKTFTPSDQYRCKHILHCRTLQLDGFIQEGRRQFGHNNDD